MVRFRGRRHLQEPIEGDVSVISQTWEAIRNFTIGGTPLGKESFINHIKSKVGALFREKYRELSFSQLFKILDNIQF